MNNDWTWNDDYTMATCPTDDPRVFAVIQRDDQPHSPDGCGMPPIVRVGDRTEALRPCGLNPSECSENEAIAELLAEAIRRWGLRDERTERYARMFLGADHLEVISSSHDRGGDDYVFLLDEPGEDGWVTEWQAWLDGEVYGIGVIVCPDRLTHDDEVDLSSDNAKMESWGYFGYDWAKEAALEEATCATNCLPEFLPVDVALDSQR